MITAIPLVNPEITCCKYLIKRPNPMKPIINCNRPAMAPAANMPAMRAINNADQNDGHGPRRTADLNFTTAAQRGYETGEYGCV